ncbi:shikimate kinase [uncultured Parasphingorhabdus sp.]|uniref:shikimate kinase n=1 Tax=uncultured Parasphingorhabdus sp. TaxID=2709694 RepID=UPI002AA7B8D1|nr:shikimate kinase [uncultured Parasphingorhabdus sp.]
MEFAPLANPCIAFAPMDKNIKASFDISDGNSGETPDYVPDRSIVLVGLMGVGKTTVGRRLAKRLGLDFVDADEEIEQAAGLTVEEIFSRFGEDYFRDGERRVIARLMEGERQVIATGGGAFMNPETRALILENALSIWLDADLDTLVKRVARRNTRPLLKSGDPAKILADLAAVRNPVYATAHIHVMGNDSPHEITVEKIIEALQR